MLALSESKIHCPGTPADIESRRPVQHSARQGLDCHASDSIHGAQSIITDCAMPAVREQAANPHACVAERYSTEQVSALIFHRLDLIVRPLVGNRYVWVLLPTMCQGRLLLLCVTGNLPD